MVLISIALSPQSTIVDLITVVALIVAPGQRSGFIQTLPTERYLEVNQMNALLQSDSERQHANPGKDVERMNYLPILNFYFYLSVYSISNSIQICSTDSPLALVVHRCFSQSRVFVGIYRPRPSCASSVLLLLLDACCCLFGVLVATTASASPTRIQAKVIVVVVFITSLEIHVTFAPFHNLFSLIRTTTALSSIPLIIGCHCQSIAFPVGLLLGRVGVCLLPPFGLCCCCCVCDRSRDAVCHFFPRSNQSRFSRHDWPIHRQ